MYYKDVAKEFKTVVSVDLGAATLRMRMSRFAPGFPLKHAGDVVLPLDTLHTNVDYISPEEALAGPKSLLEDFVGLSLVRAIFVIQLSTNLKFQPVIFLASTPIDWSAGGRGRGRGGRK